MQVGKYADFDASVQKQLEGRGGGAVADRGL